MNYQTIIIIVLVIIIVLILITNNKEKLEHLTSQSDEAIQNLASLYNKDQLTITNLVATTFNLLPKGIIVAWTGSTAPTGWAICDGQNGTPNLTGRFILGGPTYGEIGGASQYTLSPRQIPPLPHSHNLSLPRGDQGWGQRSNCGSDCNTLWGNTLTPSRQFTTDASIAGGNGSGGADPYPVMPPYYKLAYIMKL